MSTPEMSRREKKQYMEEGIKLGQAEERNRIARNLLKENVNFETIIRATGIKRHQLKKPKKSPKTRNKD